MMGTTALNQIGSVKAGQTKSLPRSVLRHPLTGDNPIFFVRCTTGYEHERKFT
jgi:hypothetical protein